MLLAALALASSFVLAEPLKAGDAFPYERLDSLSPIETGNGRVRSSELKGSLSVVVFWTSWCPYCKKQMSGLNDIYSKLKGRGLKVVGVNKEDSRSAAEEAAKKMSFPQAYDEGQRLALEFGVTGIPVTVLIGKDGKVVFVQKGYSDTRLTGLPGLLESRL